MNPTAVFDLIRVGLGPASLLSARPVGPCRRLACQMQPVQYRRAVTVSGSPQHGTDRRACSHRRDVANNYELLMLDALLFNQCSPRPGLYGTSLRFETTMPSSPNCAHARTLWGRPLQGLAEIGLASWREKRRQVAPASVEAIAVERTRITKAVMAAGFQVRLQNR